MEVILLNKNILAIGMAFLFILSVLAPLTFGYNVRICNYIEQSSMSLNSGNTLYVGGSGPGNYTKIQEAVKNGEISERRINQSVLKIIQLKQQLLPK